MTAGAPTVSAIIIFKDEERFISEAISSVLEQTSDDWELLLVDDGSTDASTDIAREVAAGNHPKVRYLEHPDHENRGMSASRNLGISEAMGTFIAFLDADDKWLPEKLERQVADLTRHPEAAMVFGPLLRWRRWTGEPDAENYEHLVGNGWKRFGEHPYAGQIIEPPKLCRLILKDDYFIPSGCLIRRSVLDEVGRFEAPFRGWFEDAVVMVKISLRFPVYVSPDVLYLYRWHPDSCTQLLDDDAVVEKRNTYYAWVERHLRENDMYSPRMRLALARGALLNRYRATVNLGVLNLARAAGRVAIPRRVRDQLRDYWREKTRPSVSGR